jgi:hypothetical protein
MNAKLTKPQLRMLADLALRGDTVNESYAPAIRLIELGYAEKTHNAFGSMNIYITDAGRAALRKVEG